MKKYVWIHLILVVSFIVSQGQVCKLKQNFQNLLQMNEKETYHLYLEDFFVGDGLMYQLNDNNQYFQVNPPIYQGGIQGEPISLVPKPKKTAQQKEFLLLLKVNEGDQDTYEIHSLKKFSNKRRFTASEFIVRFNSDSCNQMNSFDNFIIITCLDFEQVQLNYLIFDSDYQLINTFNVNIKYAQKESKIMSKSAGKYLCTLINNGQQKDNEYVSNYSNLIIFQLETQNLADSKTTLNFVQLNQIQIPADFITDFDIVKEGYLFISYFNLGIQIHQLNSQKQYQLDISIKKRILGIRVQKISYGFTEYNIVYWDEQNLSNFLYEPIKNKIISWEKIIQTNQINLSLNFVTSVFINDKYIVVSNTYGISIYPTIINDVNEGMLLYYYPSKSTISYFINIIDYLVSIEEGSLILYMINDPLIKINNIEFSKTPQSFQIRAIANQFDKPQVECPILNLYFQVQQEYKNIEQMQSYYNLPYEVFYTRLYKGVYQDIEQPIRQIKIKIDQDQIYEIKQNQLIVRNNLDIQVSVTNTHLIKIQFDQLRTEYKTHGRLYYRSDVAYSKQQLLYQYQKEFQFREKFYVITQSYFKLDLKECAIDNPDICEHIHTQNLEISNVIIMFGFNIHDGYIYLAITQELGWKGYDNFQYYNLQVQNVLIFRIKLNEKNQIAKKYQIFHMLLKIFQIDIIDDRFYMLYDYQDQTYLFSSKITEIDETLDILQVSHKVDYCRSFAFNIEFYGYFLYFVTIQNTISNDQETIWLTYLNVVNIEDGKFELINKIIYKGQGTISNNQANYITITKGGVYIFVFSAIQPSYLTKSDFLSMVFTQSKDKNYEKFIKQNIIELPIQDDIYLETNSRIKRSSSEKYCYVEPVYQKQNSILIVYQMRSTILNSIHYILNDVVLDVYRNYITSLKKDIFSIHKFEDGVWKMQGLSIQFLKHEPLITINCKADPSAYLNQIIIPFSIVTDQLTSDRYPQYQLIIVPQKNNQENNEQQNSQQQNSQQQNSQQQNNQQNVQFSLDDLLRRIIDQIQQSEGIQIGLI